MRAGSLGSARGIGNTRDEFSELFDVYWPIGLAILVVIWALVGWFVWRYRSDSTEPAGGKADSHIEEVYAGVVALVVAGLLFFTYTTMDDMSPAADATVGDGPLVEVVAARWNWRFEYPEHGIAVQGTKERTPTLVVPVDTPVRFRQTSRDVIHSFWIPELRFKRDAFPGRTIEFTLLFPDEGTMRNGGECAEFCGLDHAGMSFHVRVVSTGEFERWLEERP